MRAGSPRCSPGSPRSEETERARGREALQELRVRVDRSGLDSLSAEEALTLFLARAAGPAAA
ncbi:hypothetical protein, partial [Phenylobacterium sp.]|uniref:hypothetical protein n=1 Tax=Phenylobacterium sp. TaxID=1871053 RepID=UPI002FE026A9